MCITGDGNDTVYEVARSHITDLDGFTFQFTSIRQIGGIKTSIEKMHICRQIIKSVDSGRLLAGS